ncbi:hypothetical protein RAS1_09550 [Phycisphaerae bacterium RAS1]|nr:hypothetical protein RAS1_09550 [Phycisphaerae bacterium RAS1]
MKPPFLIGIGLAAVVAIAAFVSPTLRSAESKAAVEAAEKAELARRQLARFDLLLPSAAARAPAADLKDATPAALEGAREAIQAAAQQASADLRRLNESAAAAGLATRQPEPVGADPGSVQRAAAALDAAVKVNDALLADALKAAREAKQIDNSPLIVASVLGAAEYTRSTQLLNQAGELRARLARELTNLLNEAAVWKRTRGSADYFRGLDSAATLGELKAMRDALAAKKESRDAAAALAAQVSEREQALDKAKADLAKANAEIQALEARGFRAGDDASFAAYRTQHAAASQRIKQVQSEAQLLERGGRKGAELVGENLAEAEIRGGEAVVSLDQLRRQQAAADDRVAREAASAKAIEQQIKFLEQVSADAASARTRYAARLAELEAVQTALVEEIKQLATRATEKEQEALAAAQAAAAAFRDAQKAIDDWKRQAADVQATLDTAGTNERLKFITQRTRYAAHFGNGAEAAARMLAARVHAQRVASGASLIAKMGLFGEIRSGDFTFDASPFETALATARDEGVKSLEDARSKLEKLATPAETAWIAQAATAATFAIQLQLQTDPATQETLKASALDALGKALEKREQSPYLAAYVALRTHLQGGAAKPAEEKKAEDEGGLFEDEENGEKKPDEEKKEPEGGGGK